MDKLDLNEKTKLRPRVVSFMIDESNEDIKFENGIAAIKIKILALSFDENCTYSCAGIIDQNFKEIFNDSTEIGQNLMFLNKNKELIRVDAENFISIREYNDYDGYHKYSNHIRIKDKIATYINKNLPVVTKTFNPEVFICDNQLYSAKLGKYITRKYTKIESLEPRFDGDYRYLVIDKIKSKTEEVNNPEIETDSLNDTFIFEINENDEIISGIYSKLNLDWYTNLKIGKNYTYDEIRDQRLEELNTSLEIGKKCLQKIG